MTDNLAIIRTYAHVLGDDDLAKAWRMLYDEWTIRRTKKAKHLRSQLLRGDQVYWLDPRGNQVFATIQRVKRKYAIVEDKNKTCWNIAIASLYKV